MTDLKVNLTPEIFFLSLLPFPLIKQQRNYHLEAKQCRHKDLKKGARSSGAHQENEGFLMAKEINDMFLCNCVSRLMSLGVSVCFLPCIHARVTTTQ